MNETTKRTNKAQAIAAVLATAGATAHHAAVNMDEIAWRLAAETGWHCAKAENVPGIAAKPWATVSQATRDEVVELLAADERRRDVEARRQATADVFASIAAGTLTWLR